MTRRGIIVVDVQNDFCEGGALAVTGGNAVAERINEFFRKGHGHDYDYIAASKDWHKPAQSNDGHFAMPPDEPDFQDSWPWHCQQGTPGADFHPAIQEVADHAVFQDVFYKGQGCNAYSAFEGFTPSGYTLEKQLLKYEIDVLDVVGLALDFCVVQTAIAAKALQWVDVNVVADFTAAVSIEGAVQTQRALEDKYGIPLV